MGDSKRACTLLQRHWMNTAFLRRADADVSCGSMLSKKYFLAGGHFPVLNATEASKGTGLQRVARPAYPSVAQLLTIRLAVPQPRGGEPGITERPQGARSNGKKDMIAEHSFSLPQPAGHQGIGRRLIRVVDYGL